jgi:hypothetical protein
MNRMRPIQSLHVRTRNRAFALRRTAIVKANLRLPDTPTSAGVWAITVVRDEADVVGVAIDHLLKQGVSHVLAIDHLSSDETTQVMAQHGDVVTVVPYRHAAFAQGTLMTALARHAARHGAEWIVPFDADEIWWTCDGRPLAEHLLARTDDVARAMCWNYLPTASDSADESPVCRLTHRDEKPAEAWSKVAFRSHARVTVEEGNHGVSPERRIGSGLVIAHYPYRSRDQFIRKALQGNAGLSAARQPSNLGTNWRELGVFDATQLGQIWDDFVVTHQLPYDLWHAPGVLTRDPEARSLRGVPRNSHPT